MKKIKSERTKKSGYGFITALLFITLATSCETVKPAKTKKFHPQPNAALNERIKLVERTVADQDNRLSDLSFQMKQLIETNNSAVRKINQLSKENVELKKKIAMLERNSVLLADNLDKERNARTDQNNRLLNEIVKKTTALINANNAQINKMLNKLQQNSSFTNTKPSSASLPGNMQGKFYEYKVQPGATLIAIAKAYKVTVSEIKQANNLKSDRIRVGQTLYIPKK
jgi:LysM repeat protein